MKAILTTLALAIGACAGIATAQEITWKKQQLTDKFYSEGMAAGDFNKDGKMDVVYGPYWWEGPDFKTRHTIYPDTVRSKVKKADGTEIEIAGYKGALSHENSYSDNFLTYTYDFNGDGWTDVLVLGFPGKE